MSDTQFVAQVVIEAPIETVWEAITRRGEVLPHFFGNVMHTPALEPGAPIQMRSPNGKYAGVVGEITVCDPPHKFAHTFRFTNFDDPPCEVVYELKEVDGGTEFTLISDKVPTGTKTAKQMAQGGQFITDVLKSVVETGQPSLSKRMILGLIKLTAPLAPAKCRAENWPLEVPVA